MNFVVPSVLLSLELNELYEFPKSINFSTFLDVVFNFPLTIFVIFEIPSLLNLFNPSLSEVAPSNNNLLDVLNSFDTVFIYLTFVFNSTTPSLNLLLF